ncbi:DUF4362 domain-containing protein [Cohnella hashimotonis]|uniref:DUF4362 domain-containing protein n=1 Tax=Cohnella hashimotonis TaxID=2826895 RepID=A0ABT6TG94_9BACL|nr:DUF4362 domain-containing protein [Cohnella hashimotonis]MDI4645859.1 DUF4362 domain-containing protein [Cohnella hashimotonis]
MKKTIFILGASLALLSGCGENTVRPTTDQINPTTAPAPGETIMPIVKPKPFPPVSDPYDPDQAAKNGDVVNVHGKMYNFDKWKLFLASLQGGSSSQIRITQYTIEGDPIFYELVYDGAQAFAYTYDNSRDKFGSDAGRPRTICKGIELEKNEERGDYYKLTGCDSDKGNTFWFPDMTEEV